MRESDEARAGRIPDLERLYSGRKPSVELEERVVEDFRRSTGSGPRRRGPRFGPRGATLQAAAAVVVFMTGWAAGASVSDGAGTAPVGPADAGPGVMLLLWEGGGFDASGDAEATAAEYAAWARSVAGTGVAISGEELGAGRTIVGDPGAVPGGSARLGGYFLLGTGSLEEARRLVQDHPHLARGGAIEIATIVRR